MNLIFIFLVTFLEQACKNRWKNLTLQYYPSTVKCPKDEKRCDGVKCINVTKRCDGQADCVDGSDEAENNCCLESGDEKRIG